MSATKEITFTCGILLCGTVRNFLKLCKFRGFEIEWFESSGWIDRDWVIKGKEEDVKKVQYSLYKWSKEMK